MGFFILFILFGLHSNIHGLWDKDVICPQLCTCRLEHITETSIHRFMVQDKQYTQHATEAVIIENNDVLYEDNFNNLNQNLFVRSATCIVQTETNTEDLLNEIPIEVQSITLIQAVDSGNKSIKFSSFVHFNGLKIIELQSSQTLNEQNTSHFICEIDSPVEQLEYLNFERVLFNNSRQRYEILENEASEGVATFEYVQKMEGNVHPLTFVQRGANKKILPYKKYIENQKDNIPLFIGFTNLVLLRIEDCDVNNVHWEMFEGLNNLNYLILEKNNLRFIPDFAFYGTPNLKSLSLARNNLLNIQITDLAGLLELEYLDLSSNNFSQLSELSLPPFPKLKLANFANNPITVVFPNTFEVMNTTNALILGGLDEPLGLLTNSFLGLKLLNTLTLLHLNITLLQREIFKGMPNLKELIMTGNIPEIEYDAFLEVFNLDILILTKCNLSKLSMDTFVGLNNLKLLDMSKNELEFLPPGLFNDLENLKELYLNGNKFNKLPRDIFSMLHTRLIRLNDNPWHCSCDMSEWKPIVINRVKQTSIKVCDSRHDKGVGCSADNTIYFKYIYENRVAPKCTLPKKYENWSIFHVMRKQFKCPDFKPKFKKSKLSFRSKSIKNIENSTKLDNSNEISINSESNELFSTKTYQTKNIDALEKYDSTENYYTDSTEKLNIHSTENVRDSIKLDKLNRKLSRHLKLNKMLVQAKSSQKQEQNNLSAFNDNVADDNLIQNNFENTNQNTYDTDAPGKRIKKYRKPVQMNNDIFI